MWLWAIFARRSELKRNPHKREWAIDSADGKEWIRAICEGADPSALKQFFDARMNWCGGYPLVHDRFVTYGAFDDLMDLLNADSRISLLPFALQLAESVPDQQFHAALFLLGGMIPDDAIRPRPAELSSAFLRLRLRCEKLSFLPNITCAWDQLAIRQRYLKSASDFLAPYSPAQLAIDKSSWRRFFPFPLVNQFRHPFADCTLPMDRIRQRIQSLGSKPGVRKLVYVTRIEASRYWVWRIPGQPDTFHLCRIVFVRLSASGKADLGHWDLHRQFYERDTPEAISTRLLEIEFYPQSLQSLNPKN